MMKKEKISEMHQLIFDWYEKEGRHDLPWRKTEDVYFIAVSEIMLQQTNVPKVIEKFKEFTKNFATIEALAAAGQSTVMQWWQGLGYNRRAIYLHKMAQSIVRDYDGRFPTESCELVKLSGIGPYTSRSILIFAYNENIATWDVNIIRILRRWCGKKEISEKEVEKWANTFLPEGRSRDWHNALMDFASLICTKRSPKCTECPLDGVCKSFPDPDDHVRVVRKEVGRSECGKHIPRRIYRGRIVEFLRGNSGSVADIGPMIKKDWSVKKDSQWCEGVLKGLKKDEMVTCKKGVWMLQ